MESIEGCLFNSPCVLSIKLGNIMGIYNSTSKSVVLASSWHTTRTGSRTSSGAQAQLHSHRRAYMPAGRTLREAHSSPKIWFIIPSNSSLFLVKGPLLHLFVPLMPTGVQWNGKLCTKYKHTKITQSDSESYREHTFLCAGLFAVWLDHPCLAGWVNTQCQLSCPLGPGQSWWPKKREHVRVCSVTSVHQEGLCGWFCTVSKNMFFFNTRLKIVW